MLASALDPWYPARVRQAIGTAGVDIDPQVFVLDDDPAVLDSIERLLRSAGFHVAALGSAEELFRRLPSRAPACLVLDVRLPGTNGLDLQRELADHDPCLPVVFVTAHGDIPMSVRAIKAGAVGFLPKPFSDDDLLTSVRQALEQASHRFIAREQLRALREHYEQLTPRERQVLALVVSGMPNKEVASQLSIAEATVKIHRSHIMQKMQARSLADLVRMTERIGAQSRGSEHGI